MKHSEGFILKQLAVKNIPKIFISTSKTDFPHWKFTLPPPNQYIYGGVGVGKTRLLCTIARELVSYSDTNFRFEYTSSVKLLYSIRQSYHNNFPNEEHRIINLYSNVDILLLDDLGVEKETEWSLQVLYLILNNRYENQLTTVITSNLDLDGLSATIGSRIVSRICEMCEVINLIGNDKRIKYENR